MKCPHCGYEHGWSPDAMKSIEGVKGDFYFASNNIQMLREDKSSYYKNADTSQIIGCPSCFKLFMDNNN